MRSNTRRSLFSCQKEQCQYTSTEFNKTLNHVWDKHGLTARFLYQCGVAGCTRKFTNIQTYRKHARDSSLGFTTLILNVTTKMPQFPNHFYWQVLTIKKMKIALLIIHEMIRWTMVVIWLTIAMFMWGEVGRKSFTMKILIKML